MATPPGAAPNASLRTFGATFITSRAPSFFSRTEANRRPDRGAEPERQEVQDDPGRLRGARVPA